MKQLDTPWSKCHYIKTILQVKIMYPDFNTTSESNIGILCSWSRQIMEDPLCHKLWIRNWGKDKQWGLENVLHAILCILAGKALTINLSPVHLATPFSASLDLLILWVLHWLCIYCCVQPSWPKDCYSPTDRPWTYQMHYGLLPYALCIMVYCHVQEKFHFGAFGYLENVNSSTDDGDN